MTEREIAFEATPEKGNVSALLTRPRGANWLVVLSHAASTNMRHASMSAIAEALFEVKIAAFRYQFPYMEKGGGGLDGRATCYATVRAAVAAARKAAPRIRLLAGGRSFGGRMTSMADAEESLGVSGLVFYGFPLHPSKKPSVDRADHLNDVSVPMLFLSGTRDDLADLDLLKPVCKRIGKKARLEVVEGADHSFKVLKRSGRTEGDVQTQLAEAVRLWAESL